MIFSIVDRKKWGLFSHSYDLHKLYLGQDVSIECLHCEDANPLVSTFSFIDLARRCRRGDTLLIWNVGLCFILSPIFRLFGAVTIYTYHEPASLNERFGKVGLSIKPIIVSLLFLIYMKLFTRIVVLNRSKAVSLGFNYAPLPFIQEKKCSKELFIHDSEFCLVFLGAPIEARMIDQFKKIVESESFRSRGWKYRFFPSRDCVTEQQKIVLLTEHKSVIWNPFSVPYNQSGVTVDGMRYSVPTIVSQYELIGLEERDDPFMRIDSHCADVDMIFDGLDIICREYIHCFDKMYDYSFKYFSPNIIRSHWDLILGVSRQ